MNFKSILCVAAVGLMVVPTYAQRKKKDVEPEGYKFETVIELPITPIKNQASSGTCWAYGTLSFLESEIMKAGYKGNPDLSEMFIVHNAYRDRAEKYVRLHGHLNFAAGSSFGNVLQVMKDDGIVPQEVMQGLNYGTDANKHGELDAVTKAYVQAIIKNPNRTLSTAWKNGFKGIIDAYLGEIPETFEVNGTEYTPKTYLESLNINMDDYIDIASWTHHPFYETMIIEVPDNWIWERAYNVPIDDLVEIIDASLEQGHTVAWAADVSEFGFNRKGLGIVPDMDQVEETGSDQARWIGMSQTDKNNTVFEAPCPELEITQEMRQEGFDNYQTTDDHAMHIYGMVKDQNGKKYYMVKNSWGEAGDYKGIWYVTEAYVRYKTMDIIVNKNVLPKDIKAKLPLK